MDDETLAALLTAETARVDWKAGGDPEKIVATLAAFGNDYEEVGGGWVICGVEERRSAAGVEAVPVGLSDDALRRVQGKVLDWCRKYLHPAILPRVETHPVADNPGHRLLMFYMGAQNRVVSVQRGQGRIAYYVRVGDDVREATSAILEALYQRKGIEAPFLDQPCAAATMADLDVEFARRTLAAFDLHRDPADYLEPDARLDALARPLVRRVREPEGERAVPTYLALLLFGRTPTVFLPGAQVDVTVYQGIHRSAEHSVMTQFTGPLPVLVEQIMARLSTHDAIEIDKSALLGEQNRWRFPRRAVEEALVNALVHRDYTDQNPTKVALFDDRIEFSNPGGVVPALDAERVREGTAGAHWRNASLATFMLRLKLAQTEGQGLRTILDESRRVSGRTARIDPQPGRFVVTIPARMPRIVDAPEAGRAGLVLVSVGGPAIASTVGHSLAALGLDGAPTLAEFVWPDPIPTEDPTAWLRVAEALRDALRDRIDQPGVDRVHLFYRGPLAFTALLGALIVPNRPLYMHPWEAGRYYPALRIDKAFLRG